MAFREETRNSLPMEGDEAKSYLGYQRQRFHSLAGSESKAGDSQCAQTVGADQNAANQICGNSGEL